MMTITECVCQGGGKTHTGDHDCDVKDPGRFKRGVFCTIYDSCITAHSLYFIYDETGLNELHFLKLVGYIKASGDTFLPDSEKKQMCHNEKYNPPTAE